MKLFLDVCLVKLLIPPGFLFDFVSDMFEYLPRRRGPSAMRVALCVISKHTNGADRERNDSIIGVMTI